MLDAVIENLVVGTLAGPPAASASTISIFQQARQNGVRVVAVRDAAGAGALAFPDQARPLVAQALATQLIVAPERPVPIGNETRTAWWQVNPSTGEVLGVLDSGLHGAQEPVERTQLAVTIDEPMAKTLAAPDPYAATQAISAAASSGVNPIDLPSLALGMGLGILVCGAALFAAAQFLTKSK